MNGPSTLLLPLLLGSEKTTLSSRGETMILLETRVRARNDDTFSKGFISPTFVVISAPLTRLETVIDLSRIPF